MTTTDPYAFLRTDLTGVPPLEAMGATYHEPAAADRIPNATPERVMYVPGPGGTMVPVLADHYQATHTLAAAGPAPTAAAAAEPDPWPKRMMAASGSVAVVLGSIALAGPHLTEAGHAAEMGGIGIALAGLGGGVLVSLVKGAVGSSKKGAVNVNVSVTNTPNISASVHSTNRNR